MKSKLIEKLKVVIDSNVIISAPLAKESNPAKIFEFLTQDEIKNFSSEDIIKEITEVFQRDKIKKILPSHKSKFIIEQFKKCSTLIKPSVKLSVITDDIADNKILECAVTAKADYIISGDEHLIKIKQYKNIKIVPPKEFIDIYTKKVKY